MPRADRRLQPSVKDDLIRANARRAITGIELAVGKTIIVGDDDWGVAPAEVVEYDPENGALVLRVLEQLQAEDPGTLSESA